MAIELRVGTVQFREGYDVSDYRVVSFEGEALGDAKFAFDERGTRGREVRFFKAADGSYVVHECIWSLWAGDPSHYKLYVYKDWDALVENWRKALEQAGVIERRRMTLDEYIDEIGYTG